MQTISKFFKVFISTNNVSGDSVTTFIKLDKLCFPIQFQNLVFVYFMWENDLLTGAV